MGDFSSLGDNLKAIREKRNLNLSEVSEMTGISKAMLSKIERGESVPTITTVWKIANGLKVTLHDLSDSQSDAYSIKNIEDMEPLVEDDGLFFLYTLFPFSPLDGVQVLYGIFKPGYHCKTDMFIHESSNKEYCMVFQGQLDVIIDGKTYSLKKGSAIDFNAKQEHGYINTGSEDAIVCFLLI